MRCNICDSVIDKPVFNKDIDTWEPCLTCLEIINNVFEDLPEQNEEKEEDDTILLDKDEEDLYNLVKE